MSTRKPSTGSELTAIRQQAEPFLRALFGDFFGRGLKGFIEIRIIGPGKKREQRFFPSIEAVLDVLPQLKTANDAGANIYIGVNPRCRERGREVDVQCVVALHVDADKQDDPSAIELAKRASIEPSIVTHSGHGLHLYWLLCGPLELAADAIRERVRGVNAALAATLGGDRACHDLGRVLRIPGFKNVKDPNEPRLVELVSVHPERRFTLNDFDFLHPVPLPSAKSLPEASDDPPEISERLDKLLESDPDVRGRFDGDPKGLNDTTASGIDLSLASLLSHRGCGFEEFTAAAKLAPYNRNRQSELTSNYLTRTWATAQSGKNSTFVSATVASTPPMSNNASVPPSLTPEQALVMLPDVLAEIGGFLQTYLALSEAQAYVLAVWIFHTHVIDAADYTPYLDISSAVKRTGKTLLLEVIYLLAHEPWFTSNASAAALARVVAKKKPTSLLDEADTFFTTESERSETLRGILNAGYRRGGIYTRCVGQGATIRVEDLDVFGPKAIAGLRELPDTIADRSIPIRMKRALPGEIRQRFYRREVESLAAAIRERIEACAPALVPCLKEARPERIEELNDRHFDIAEPLLAIADVAGNGWAERARAALLDLFAPQRDEESLSVRLLADIKEVFQPEHADAISRVEAIATEELLKALYKIEDAPWNESSRGKPISSHRLAKLLGRFGIRPDKWRAGDRTVRGYKAVAFVDAWARYLPPAHLQDEGQSATAPQSLESESSEKKARGGVADQTGMPEKRSRKAGHGSS